MLQCFDLTGKTALITGASRGLGKAFPRALATAGASVCLVAKTKDTLMEANSQLVSEGFHTMCVVADITDESQVESVVAACIAEFGKVDILVNNAGVGDHKQSKIFGRMVKHGSTKNSDYRSRNMGRKSRTNL